MKSSSRISVKVVSSPRKAIPNPLTQETNELRKFGGLAANSAETAYVKSSSQGLI